MKRRSGVRRWYFPSPHAPPPPAPLPRAVLTPRLAVLARPPPPGSSIPVSPPWPYDQSPESTIASVPFLHLGHLSPPHRHGQSREGVGPMRGEMGPPLSLVPTRSPSRDTRQLGREAFISSRVPSWKTIGGAALHATIGPRRPAASPIGGGSSPRRSVLPRRRGEPESPFSDLPPEEAAEPRYPAASARAPRTLAPTANCLPRTADVKRAAPRPPRTGSRRPSPAAIRPRRAAAPVPNRDPRPAPRPRPRGASHRDLDALCSVSVAHGRRGPGRESRGPSAAGGRAARRWVVVSLGRPPFLKSSAPACHPRSPGSPLAGGPRNPSQMRRGVVPKASSCRRPSASVKRTRIPGARSTARRIALRGSRSATACSPARKEVQARPAIPKVIDARERAREWPTLPAGTLFAV